MDDELEDKIFYQTYVSHMKLLSKFFVGFQLNVPYLNYVWKLVRWYVIKPEVVLVTLCIIVLCMYIQFVDVWSRSLVDRIRLTVTGNVASKTTPKILRVLGGDFDASKSWELTENNVAVFAIQGRRPRMEDRFVVNPDIDGTGISLYAIFDGHGGEFAADYARDNLINSLNSKIIEIKKMIKEGVPEKTYPRRESLATPNKEVVGKPPPSPRPAPKTALDRKPSVKKSVEEGTKKPGAITDPLLLQKLESIPRALTREVKPSKEAPFVQPETSSYIDNNTSINFGRLLTDEVLAADHLLVEAAKKNMDIAGTTALIALIEGSKLIVANVGDSRGVMCDSKGRAIPLSFDHKPQQVREKKRIEEAGGFVSYNGVWRVSGILATSRAMGDYPLKHKKLVIADPDILTFDLSYHKPQFLMFASDGLWDMFSNEEAVEFVRLRLESEPHFGAKSITVQSFQRGSLDNITVLVINLKDHKW
ncbi:Protein phosphatase type 2C [Nesidiocoris tenuis]|uniref:Protein phosphatase type 2C n=1 Tax=Nesidiocoris tenuis TaxID=355587 RepID=A0ABN7AGD2_9HEMI|nr:Protein phosphatase type 2C [Nesidiocoris tenuis]